jgi:NADH:ubiquinone oxidoreductase subunit F (NADH-binding)
VTTTAPPPHRTAPTPPPDPREAPAHRLLAPAPEGLAAHRHRVGPLPRRTGPELVALLRDAGLTGRGGAGFPAWRKLDSVLRATGGRGRRAVVVGNGAEGEPASRSDALVLETAPHLVLDGLALLAAAVGTTSAHLVAPAPAHPALARALAERADAGWPGPAPRLVAAGTGFVAGEESAVVATVAGRGALPWDRTAPVSERGVDGRPTLVHNVETLAHVGLLARWGAAWFRSVGSADDPGTRLVTVSGDVDHPGVLEVPGAVPLADVLRAAGAHPARAVLVGGYHGSWLGGAALAGARLSRGALSGHGATPGAGVLVVLGHGRCGLDAAARATGWLAGQSAGQCGPCANGLPAAAAALARLAAGDRDPALPGEVARLAGLAEGRGACRHPDGTARLVRSTLTELADDVAAHLAGRCLARAGAAVPR